MKSILIAYFILCSSFLFAQSVYDVSTSTGNIDTISNQTLEKKFLQKFSTISMNNWIPGMRFIVTKPDEFSMRSKLELYKYNPKIRYNEQIMQKDYEWKIFTLKYVGEKKNNSRKGTQAYYIFDCDGDEFVYEHWGSLNDLKELAEEGINGFMTGFVYLGDVDKAKELLIGKKLYINQKIAFKDREGSTEIVKYIPVTIKNIGVGRTNAPVRLVCEMEGGKSADIDVVFSGTNNVFKESFSEYFSFNNLRDRFPNIINDDWECITHEKVKIGMNKSICLLSWGKPDAINKTKGEVFNTEQWVYNPVTILGVTVGRVRCLYFEDDILKTIQD